MSKPRLLPNSLVRNANRPQISPAFPVVECPSRSDFPVTRSDTDVLDEVLAWFRDCLLCLAGRREFNRGRYMIEIATKETVKDIFRRFSVSLRSGEKIACLFVFNAPRHYAGHGGAEEAFAFLAEQIEVLGDVPAWRLADGEALSTTIRLVCPVTGIETDFDDFECIAFCPQSDDRDDPLYDPLMAAPHVCVNMASDVFAFSSFVRDASVAKFGVPPHEIGDPEILEPFFLPCVERWHRLASSTIDRFEAATGTSRCPVHVTASGNSWIAAHKDPAFAEREKRVREHALPNIYGRRIAEAWLDHFRGFVPYRGAGLARQGVLQ
ncbi:MAG: hypothetical protein IPL47_15480 [Phyllobacteriaceae bacterium]|nr:hypothetical protein [Phyllobacteriaceae bacterium]